MKVPHASVSTILSNSRRPAALHQRGRFLPTTRHALLAVAAPVVFTFGVPSRCVAQPALASAPAQGVTSTPDSTRSAIRVFSVGDIISTTHNFPLVSALITPDRLGTSPNGGYPNPIEGFPGAGFTPQRGGLPGAAAGGGSSGGRSISDLIALILETKLIDPNENNDARITPFGDSLVVSAKPDQLDRIQALLDALRSELSTSKLLQVELSVLSLEPDQAMALLGKATANTPQTFSLADLTPYGKDTVTYSATGYAGQTLHLASGRATQSLSNVQPIVGTNAVGYAGTTVLLLEGFTAEFSASLSRENKTAQLNLQGSYCANLHPNSTPTPGALSANLPPGFDADTWQFVSSITLPLGKPTLLAQTTLQPVPTPPAPVPTAAATAAATPAPPAPRQLLLIARILPPSTTAPAR